MTDIDNQIASIKARIDTLRLAKARAEATKETAQATEAAAMAKLKANFGVDSVGEARDKLAELQADLQRQLLEVTGILDQIEQ